MAAAEYTRATLKAAFQCATAPTDDPVKKIYETSRDFRAVTQDLHTKYKNQIPDWQREGKVENGDTGCWHAYYDCLEILKDRLEDAGVLKLSKQAGPIMSDGRDTNSDLDMVAALYFFADASSEFYFRQRLDYFGNNRVLACLEKMAPVMRSALADFRALDVETLRAAHEKRAERAKSLQKPGLPQP